MVEKPYTFLYLAVIQNDGFKIVSDVFHSPPLLLQNKHILWACCYMHFVFGYEVDFNLHHEACKGRIIQKRYTQAAVDQKTGTYCVI